MAEPIILIVDDDQPLRDLICTYLEQNGYTCLAAGDSKQARELLAAQDIQLLVTDIQMPGESGIDLARYVRNTYPETAIVIVSVNDDLNMAKEILKIGVYGYIVKPFERSQILITVENSLRRRELEAKERARKQTLKQEIRKKTAALRDTICELEAAQKARTLSEQMVKNQLVFLDTLIDAIPSPVFYKDTNGKYLGCNKAFANFCGVSKDEVIGKSVHDMVPTHLAASFESVDRQLFEAPGDQQYQSTIHFADRKCYEVVVHNATFKDASGSVAGIVGVIHDVTATKNAERALKESEKKYRELVQSANCVILRFDTQFRITFFNTFAQNFFGYSADEILGRNLFETIVPKNESRGSRFQELINSFMNNPDQFKYNENENIRRDGSRVWVSWTNKAIRDKDGQIIEILSVGIDNTLRKQAEQALRESESRLQTIFDTIMTGVVVIDEKTHTIVDANPNACAKIGLPRNQIVGNKCHQFICPNKEGGCPITDRDQNIDNTECYLLNKDGNKLPVIKTVVPTVLNNHSMLVESFLDISERKQTEIKIHNAHQEMAALISGISSILIGLSETDVIFQWNEEAERCFDIPAGEALGRSLSECDIRWEEDRIQAAITACRQTAETVVMDDLRFSNAAGKQGFLGLKLNAIRYDNRPKPGILIMGADITEKKLLKSQLAQAQKLESIGQLAAGIAHEINTPTQYVGDNTRFLQEAFDDLTSLLDQFQQLLAEAGAGVTTEALIRKIEAHLDEIDLDYLQAEIPTAIQQSLEGVDRVTRIVRSMKDFSHPGEEEMTCVDLNHALESTITVARNEWKYVADLTTDLDPDLPTVPCLPGELNQVFLNIIINAAHAIGDAIGSGEHGKGHIQVRTRAVNGTAEISISDTGTGIPEEIRHRIFDPFFTTKEVGKGTGQGLAISHNVVTEKHGGTLECKSTEGEGTTFIIKVPLLERAA